MDYKKLGKSDVKVTPIAFGTWAIGGWMWGGAEEQAALRAIRSSFDLGITTIDTAPVYGFGKSETLVGKAMEGISRDRYQILTKYGLTWTTTEGALHFNTKNEEGKAIGLYKFSRKERVIKECEDSLRRLRTDYLDLYQIHWPDPTTPIAETMEAIDTLLKQGKIRAAGVCNYSTELVEEALKTVNIVSNQMAYSMVNRKIEKDIIPQALEKGLSVLPYSPLERGLLTGKIKPGHSFNEGDTREDSKYYTDENIARTNAMLDKIRPVAETHNASLAQVVINWTTRQPALDCVLVGARDEKQVQDNVKALSFTLSAEELKHIDAAVDAFSLAEV